jgi:hypothetical protein
VVAYIVAAVLAGIVLCLGVRRAGRAFLNARGMRVVTCPQDRRPAAVELASWHAALTALFGSADARLRTCSRWPERGSCNQACVRQIQDAPRATLVQGILSNWCRYNVCISCGAPLAKVRVGSHRPHLINRELRIFEWREIPPEEIPETLRYCEPVCETCVVAETRTW